MIPVFFESFLNPVTDIIMLHTVSNAHITGNAAGSENIPNALSPHSMNDMNIMTRSTVMTAELFFFMFF